ncbi:sigma-70 family RNA polymerase sigma factor [Nocardia sp. NPDC005366]|uniref:sigma-70 family RNA polymerase sigma factor n=1 Tax=Nocardia sp. NPDC005366 TaxID=3156878 RepID=UPI0033A1CB54
MGTSDFDAVAPGSMSDLVPDGATFPEKVHDGLLRDHGVAGGTDGFDELDSNFTVLDQVGNPVDPAVWAACLDRVQAEFELFGLLVAHDAQGVVWSNVIEELSAYATQVLDPWIGSGKIYAQTGGKLFGLPDWSVGRERLARDQVYREEVIDHVVVRALGKLQKGLRDGTGWNPHRGLSLASYFVSGCLHEFVWVFRKEHRWWTSHHGELAAPVDETFGAVGLWGSRPNADPAQIVIDRITLIEYLATLSLDDRTLLWATISGYSQIEIAHLMQVTSKAVERWLHRIRKKARQSVRNLG